MQYIDRRSPEVIQFNIDMYNRYVRTVINNSDRYIEVVVPQKKIEKIKIFCKAVVEAKKGEKIHKIDSDGEYQRFYSGTLGEAAIEELLGVEMIDWNVGKSRFFNVADLRSIGLNIGIKTVKMRDNSFPQINIFNKQDGTTYVKRPEIINIRVSDNTVRIMGLASVELLTKYTDKRLRYGSLYNEQRPKWGFYKFDELQMFNSLEELRNLVY